VRHDRVPETEICIALGESTLRPAVRPKTVSAAFYDELLAGTPKAIHRWNRRFWGGSPLPGEALWKLKSGLMRARRWLLERLGSSQPTVCDTKNVPEKGRLRYQCDTKREFDPYLF